MKILSKLDNIVTQDNLDEVKNLVRKIYSEIDDFNDDVIIYSFNETDQSIGKNFLLKELKQILETRTIERTKYYLNRLIKSLSVQREGKINDLNLNRWKEYDDLITDSLWIFDKRDSSGVHKADYWGNFIPQIPNQLLRRFTKKGEWILDPFLGSGTTLIECKRLGRNGLGIELNKQVAVATKERLKKEKSNLGVETEIISGDSRTIALQPKLKKLKVKSFQFLILHPPYWDIIKFSNNRSDLSNAKSTEDFLKMYREVVDNTYSFLDKGRYCAVVIGDKYSSGEWIPLGFYVMQVMINKGFKLKSTIIKNFDQTTAKRNQKELWRYRALAGGFYIFKHEYIFLFQK